MSLDALRGFDMFWIVGGSIVVQRLAKASGHPWLEWLSGQMKHVEWEGFHFIDLIFPLFLFMIGVAIPYSLGKRLARGDDRTKIYGHIVLRVAILIVLGMMVNGSLLSYDPAQFELTYSVLQMLALGYQPVGKDFPVFLHPRTHEEYALARTERKTRPGYKGFEPHASPDVTLEQDLARRDLTINAMAMGDDGQLVDPHGGRRDLEAGVLRHVSPSFVEDPVRILRLGRFAARFPEFTVAPETADGARRIRLVRSFRKRPDADRIDYRRAAAGGV